MKRSLTLFVAIFSLLFLFCVQGGQAELCVEVETTSSLSSESLSQSFSQGDNYIDQVGQRGGVSSAPSVCKVVTKTGVSRRGVLDSLSGVRIAIANLYSECSYSHSCDFPFEHQPQRELFFILRNIRI